MGSDQSRTELEQSSLNKSEEKLDESRPDVVNDWIWKYAKILVFSQLISCQMVNLMQGPWQDLGHLRDQEGSDVEFV
jgi:hypothetical protein